MHDSLHKPLEIYFILFYTPAARHAHTHIFKLPQAHKQQITHPLTPCLSHAVSYLYCCGLRRLGLHPTQNLTCLPSVCVCAGIDCMYCICVGVCFMHVLNEGVSLFVCMYVCVCV